MKLLNCMSSRTIAGAAGAFLVFAATGAIAGETEEYDEARVLIEINATDGDAGFHAKVDGDPWKEVEINGSKLLNMQAYGSLREQGLTELFFESDEPPCHPSVADDPDEVVTVEEVLERFPAGTYTFNGKSIEPGNQLEGETELTHALPAAPDISGFDGTGGHDPNNTVVSWAAGSDLGVCDIPAGLVFATVLYWEVTVEPDDENAGNAALVGPKRVFRVQVPVGTTTAQVSPQYLLSYRAEGVRFFKFEVGGVEDRVINSESTAGNQTFSEGTFSIQPAI